MLTGRTAIVTGGSRGIGLAIAAALRGAGAAVCITGRGVDSLDAARETLGRENVYVVAGNTADPEHRRRAVIETVRRFGAVDILINNTGINPGFGPLVDTDLEILRKTYESNVVAALGWVQEAYVNSMQRRGGSVVNVASAAGLRPAENIGAYAASKAALIALTSQLSVELAPEVRVNAVAPAIIRTQFAQRLYQPNEESVRGRYPLGRLGEVGDVAAAVLFLASPASRWITGETMVVDGGLLQTGGV